MGSSGLTFFPLQTLLSSAQTGTHSGPLLFPVIMRGGDRKGHQANFHLVTPSQKQTCEASRVWEMSKDLSFWGELPSQA